MVNPFVFVATLRVRFVTPDEIYLWISGSIFWENT